MIYGPFSQFSTQYALWGHVEVLDMAGQLLNRQHKVLQDLKVLGINAIDFCGSKAKKN